MSKMRKFKNMPRRCGPWQLQQKKSFKQNEMLMSLSSIRVVAAVQSSEKEDGHRIHMNGDGRPTLAWTPVRCVEF